MESVSDVLIKSIKSIIPICEKILLDRQIHQVEGRGR